jgi:hypothetical protein
MNASEKIDDYISSLTDWRGVTVSRLRGLIREAAPELIEEWKWSSPAWSRNGLVCSVSAFKQHVGVNFFKGASLSDPHHLFNGGLESKASRSVNLRKGDDVDGSAFTELVRAAVDFNTGRSERGGR